MPSMMPSGLRALADALSPYLGRVAVAGLAGFSVGPVSGYRGIGCAHRR